MKRWIVFLTALLLATLLAGCGQAEDPLREGETYGITARIVPADTGLPEPIVLTGEKPMVKRFHGPERLVSEECLTKGLQLKAGDPCPICRKGTIQFQKKREDDWYNAGSIDCPTDGADTQDWLVRRHDLVQYGCPNCNYGFAMWLTYENINCRSENNVSSGT